MPTHADPGFGNHESTPPARQEHLSLGRVVQHLSSGEDYISSPYKEAALVCLLTLRGRLRAQPYRDVGWLHRLSVRQPLVESLLHRFSVVIPPFSVKRNAHFSVRRRQLRSHLLIYFGDRFFVDRCIWDEFGEPMIVLPGYAVGDQPHRLLFIGCSFRNY